MMWFFIALALVSERLLHKPFRISTANLESRFTYKNSLAIIPALFWENKEKHIRCGKAMRAHPKGLFYLLP